MRLFGSERMENMANALGLGEDDVIEHKLLTSQIENAQKRVEGNHFETRKHVLQYDDVMNTQREIIYSQRQKVLNGEDIKDVILKMCENTAEDTVARFTAESDYPEEWNWAGMLEYFNNEFNMILPLDFTDKEKEKFTKKKLSAELVDKALARYEAKENEIGSALMREIERVILLRAVDTRWMAHIDDMDQLKNGIGLRAYAQHDPVSEYKFAGFEMFEEMISGIREDTVKYLLRAQTNKKIEREQVAKPIIASHGDGTEEKKPVRKGAKVGRNDLCPCGSGKKYKKCCGMNE